MSSGSYDHDCLVCGREFTIPDMWVNECQCPHCLARFERIYEESSGPDGDGYYWDLELIREE